MGHGMRSCVRDVRRGRIDGVGGPFLLRCAINSFSIVLCNCQLCSCSTTEVAILTLMAIQEIGSSFGISVRLTRLSSKVWSSNSKVKMAPGGVQVPTKRWCFGIALRPRGNDGATIEQEDEWRIELERKGKFSGRSKQRKTRYLHYHPADTETEPA